MNDTETADATSTALPDAATRLRAVLAIQDRDERPNRMGCGYPHAPLLRSDIRALVEFYERTAP